MFNFRCQFFTAYWSTYGYQMNIRNSSNSNYSFGTGYFGPGSLLLVCPITLSTSTYTITAYLQEYGSTFQLTSVYTRSTNNIFYWYSENANAQLNMKFTYYYAGIGT